MSRVTWMNGQRFAIIPELILYGDVSDKAVRLFGALARHADQEGRAMPSRKKLSQLLHMSTTSVDKALRELVTFGAVSVVPKFRDDGSQTANDYVLHPTPGSGTVTPLHADGEGALVADGDPKKESLLNERETFAIAQVSPGAPPKILQVDGQNIPLNALCEVCGIDPNSKDPAILQAVAALNGRAGAPGIVHLYWDAAYKWAVDHHQLDKLNEVRDDPVLFSEALARAIRAKAVQYQAKMGDAILTPTALHRWWMRLDNTGGTNSNMTAEDMRRLA